MRDRTNCPNCGAVINGCKCDYCGTQFWDLADIDMYSEGTLKIKLSNNQVIECKAIPLNIELIYGPYDNTELNLSFSVSNIIECKK